MLALASKFLADISMDTSPQHRTLKLELKDGLVADLRPILPEDAPLLEEGLNELSEASRFARFGVGLDHLSKHELTYLTDLDLFNHVAFGAMVGDEGAGIARYVMLPDRKCAEVAVTVVDRFQRKGLGRQLFNSLVAVARHDQVPVFCFEVSPTNEPVKRLLRVVTGQGAAIDLLHREVPISEIPSTPMEAEVVSLLQEYRSSI